MLSSSEGACVASGTGVDGRKEWAETGKVFIFLRHQVFALFCCVVLAGETSTGFLNTQILQCSGMLQSPEIEVRVVQDVYLVPPQQSLRRPTLRPRHCGTPLNRTEHG